MDFNKVPGSNLASKSLIATNVDDENSKDCADGKARCMTNNKFSSTRCSKPQSENSEFCSTHMKSASKFGVVDGFTRYKPTPCASVDSGVPDHEPADQEALTTHDDSENSQNSETEEPLSQFENVIDVPLTDLFDDFEEPEKPGANPGQPPTMNSSRQKQIHMMKLMTKFSLAPRISSQRPCYRPCHPRATS